jgi:predicted PurR-regulated permease PerM
MSGFGAVAHAQSGDSGLVYDRPTAAGSTGLPPSLEIAMITANGRFWLLTVLIAGGLIYLLAPVLTPFVVAALLAYLADPLVDRMERWSIKGHALGRTGAVVLVFVALMMILVLVLLWLVPMLERQIGRLINELPRYFQWFQDTALPWVTERLGLETPALDGGQVATLLGEHWRTAGGVATTVLSSVSKSGMAVINWLINLVLIPVVTFYLLRDWDALVVQVDRLVPRPNAPVVRRLARESDQVLGAFLRGQMLVMLCLATIYSVGLWIVGINLALLIGLVAGIISFVPYLGAIVGVGMAVIAALVQFGELWPLVGVAIVFGIGQTVEGFVLQPLLLGDRIGLHPVAVMFAVMAGGQLFGFLGVLLALPVAAVLMVVLRYLHQRYRSSDVYAGIEPEPAPKAEPVVVQVEVAAPAEAVVSARGAVQVESPAVEVPAAEVPLAEEAPVAAPTRRKRRGKGKA